MTRSKSRRKNGGCSLMESTSDIASSKTMISNTTSVGQAVAQCVAERTLPLKKRGMSYCIDSEFG